MFKARFLVHGIPMILKTISYRHFQGDPQEWALENLALGQINLITGKNASGKSMTLGVVVSLAKLLSGSAKIDTESAPFEYDVIFDYEHETYRYRLSIRNGKIVLETLQRDDQVLLTREGGGKGRIFTEHVSSTDQTMLDFQPPENELGVVVRRDAIQHPFLQPLWEWGRNARYYPFGTPLGRTMMSFLVKGLEKLEIDETNTENVLPIFQKGKELYPNIYHDMIIEDMKRLGYDLEDIRVQAPQGLSFRGAMPGEPVVLVVKERDRTAVSEQLRISQGMFRALSLLIQLNFALMNGTPSSIVIDDIGEGLDFDRSCDLIELLMEKVKGSSVQLVMATNDRFIMNKVPLEYWTVLRRENGRTRIYNYENSKEIFDEFSFTGLNNFDFLATDFLQHADAATS